MTKEDLARFYGITEERNKPITTTANPQASAGYSGAPGIQAMRGSMDEPFGGNRYDPNFVRQTIFSPSYLKEYQPEDLSGPYAPSNQNKANQ
ncbi:MAG: hypothetical protein ACON43_02550 [Flavobacteriaceae bacterium]